MYGRSSVRIRASNIRLLASNAERVQKADGSVGKGANRQGPAQTVALKEEAIPHTAISNCTRHFFLVNTLGESEFDSDSFIERFQLFRWKA